MTHEQIDPVDMVIGQRALLAPKASVFIGVGDREARYLTQLKNMWLPLIFGASQVPAQSQGVCEKLYWTELVKQEVVSEQKISPPLAIYTLMALCRLAYAVKHGGMYSVRTNYALPRFQAMGVQRVVVKFVESVMEPLLELHAVFYPVVQEKAVEVAEVETVSQ